ncbi:MAG: MarR family transcriptional regulator [Bacteroidetes bacterium]|nr:MAG: MarR family transcriptional regulator [Bacteroidota bacterium]
MRTHQSTDEATSVERLERSFYDLNDVYRKHREYIKTKYRINALEMEIIQLIVLDGKKKMKEIGDYFNIKLSTLTSIIDKIERQKLVKRVNGKHDRRVVYLEVSKKGEKLYADYSRYLHVVSQLMRRSLASEQFDAFVTGLEKMSEIVKPSS